MILIILSLVVLALIWKLLDVRSLDELQSVFRTLFAGNEQHIVSNLFQVSFLI